MAYEDLKKLGIVSDETSTLFLPFTRDNPNLKVYQDNMSKVIYIKDNNYDVKKYASGSYLKEDFEKTLQNNGLEDYGFVADTERRFNELQQFFIGKDIVDFGCGSGLFLQKAFPFCKSCAGVELNESNIKHLDSLNINACSDLSIIEDSSVDTIFFFHCLEHLSSPLAILRLAYSKLRKGGHIIIEVPHANDFLISNLKLKPFIHFTMWSQHLVFHTYNSLELFQEACNFSNIIIRGIQRYPLSNHINWLLNSKPGGHVSDFSFLDNTSLRKCYESSLASICATDTIISIGTKL